MKPLLFDKSIIRDEIKLTENGEFVKTEMKYSKESQDSSVLKFWSYWTKY